MVFLRYHLPVIVYAVFIFVGSSLSSLPPEIPVFNFGDKILHFCEFGVLGLLFWRSIRLWNIRWKGWPILILAWGLGICYAASDEIHQLFVPGRQADVTDWLADIIGLAAGLGAAYIFSRNSRIEKSLPD